MVALTASGVALIHQSGRLLLLRRRPDCVAGGCWAYPGGKIERGETPEQAALRELQEETRLVYRGPMLPLAVTGNGFQGYAALVDQALAPQLNDEHTAFVWAPFGALPQPLHPQLLDPLFIAADPAEAIRRMVARMQRKQ